MIVYKARTIYKKNTAQKVFVLRDFLIFIFSHSDKKDPQIRTL